MLAQSRAARAVEVADLLAGMYIYDWERLSKYWEDQDNIEQYLQQICRISPQRWHHWIQFYDQQRHGDARAGSVEMAAAFENGKNGEQGFGSIRGIARDFSAGRGSGSGA